MSSIGKALANAPELLRCRRRGYGGTQGGKGGDAGSVGASVMDPTAVMELLSSRSNSSTCSACGQ